MRIPKLSAEHPAEFKSQANNALIFIVICNGLCIFCVMEMLLEVPKLACTTGAAHCIFIVFCMKYAIFAHATGISRNSEMFPTACKNQGSESGPRFQRVAIGEQKLFKLLVKSRF